MMKQRVINQSLLQAAAAAGKILRSAFEKGVTQEMSKGAGGSYYDVVSKADLQAEKAILKILKKNLPGINILSEETGLTDRGSMDTIIVDPLDGTSNFLLGIPHFSVALAHVRNGEVIASAVYNPVLKKMYFAEKSKGTFINKKKQKRSPNISLSYVAINFSHQDTWPKKGTKFNSLYKQGTKRVLNNWSPNLDFCLLAEGKIDAVISSGSLIFDFAPGLLIATEAGYGHYPENVRIGNTIDGTAKLVTGPKGSFLKALLK